MLALKVNDADNVATVFEERVEPETPLDIHDPNGAVSVLVVHDDIPYGHKVALADIGAGENIVKYGEIIGAASKDISAGCHVHVQNMDSLRGRGDLDHGI